MSQNRTMTGKRSKKEGLIYPIVVIVFVLGMATYSAVTREEIFPFAPFKMYSYGFSGDDLTLVRILCTEKGGRVVPVSFFRLLKVESYYTTEIEELLSQKESLDEADKERIRLRTSPLKKETQRWCAQLAVYRLHWDRFEGRKRDQPTSKELLLEL